MEQKNITGAVQAGQTVWAFRCKNCQSPIAILNELDELDDVVELKFPKCGQSHSYPKTEARRALAHTKQ